MAAGPINFSTQSYTQLLRSCNLLKISFSPVIGAVHRHVPTDHCCSSFILPSEVKQQHVPPSTSYVGSVKAAKTTAASSGCIMVVQFCVCPWGTPKKTGKSLLPSESRILQFHISESCHQNRAQPSHGVPSWETVPQPELCWSLRRPSGALCLRAYFSCQVPRSTVPPFETWLTWTSTASAPCPDMTT